MGLSDELCNYTSVFQAAGSSRNPPLLHWGVDVVVREEKLRQSFGRRCWKTPSLQHSVVRWFETGWCFSSSPLWESTLPQQTSTGLQLFLFAKSPSKSSTGAGESSGQALIDQVGYTTRAWSRCWASCLDDLLNLLQTWLLQIELCCWGGQGWWELCWAPSRALSGNRSLCPVGSYSLPLLSTQADRCACPRAVVCKAEGISDEGCSLPGSLSSPFSGATLLCVGSLASSARGFATLLMVASPHQ